MRLIDEVMIHLKAGDGGDGCASFRREKYIEMGGPDGGNGGRGGSIIIEGNAHLNTLLNFRYKQCFKADNGQSGMRANKTGKSGKDLVLKVPLGTQVFTDNEILLNDILYAEQSYAAVKGGQGGLGNHHFKSSINQAPRRCTKGIAGEEMLIRLRLKLLSDAGLVGLPNAGKSTLLTVVTAAKVKIADYPFTTLSPSLGVVYIDHEEFVLADLPGLIEGAHLGHGCGDKFLKHIERCRIIIHLIDASSNDVVRDYHTVQHELMSYSMYLCTKPTIICLSKCELIATNELSDKIQLLQTATQQQVVSVSAHTHEGIKELLKLIIATIARSDAMNL